MSDKVVLDHERLVASLDRGLRMRAPTMAMTRSR